MIYEYKAEPDIVEQHLKSKIDRKTVEFGIFIIGILIGILLAVATFYSPGSGH